MILPDQKHAPALYRIANSDTMHEGASCVSTIINAP